ncbi:MAG: hypothetical protein ACFFBD_10980 [Candidatus Hodarchaeota archaeon]
MSGSPSNQLSGGCELKKDQFSTRDPSSLDGHRHNSPTHFLIPRS